MINKDRIIKEFIELVEVDSETGDERNIANLLIEKCKSLGLSVVEDNSINMTKHGAGNIIASLASNDLDNEYSNIYFTSHMDTVVPGKCIEAIIDGEYITSKGATILGGDDKAGIAAILEAIMVISEQKIAHGKVQFIFTVGEESGLKGAKYLQRELLNAEYGYALDSGGEVGTVIIAAPTQAKITTFVYGKSAHAGVNPEDGISAIQVASKAIARMKLGRIDSETTANIGMFNGGKATNIVCDQVEIISEARSLNLIKLTSQIEHMRETFEKTAEEYLTKVDFSSEIMYPAFNFSKDDILVRKTSNAIKAIGREPELIFSGGGSDANIINGYGIPTINLGIGMENIHTTDEKIAVAELLKAPELIVELIKEALKKD